MMPGTAALKRPDPATLVSRWNGEPHTLETVREGVNAVYRFRASKRRLVLRLTQDRHRDRDQLEAELDFVRFVSSRGIAAALPEPTADNRWVETLAPDDATEGWHAVAFIEVPGRHFEFFTADVDRPLFGAWGRTMGALHAASRAFVPVAGRRRDAWTDQDGTRCDAAKLPPSETAARREHARLTEWLRERGSTPESWGLIHGDFERTNFVLDGSTLRVFDFDDACYHWYLADIAHALWAFRAAPPSDRTRFLEWFLEGYREQSPVDVDVRDELSFLIRLRSLSLFALRIEVSAANGRSEGDERWARRMRADFEKPFSW